MNKKLIISSVAFTIVAIIAVSLVAPTFPEISAKTSVVHYLDFGVKVPIQIDVKRGETIKIPVDIYGSTKSRNVDIVVTRSDLKRGAIMEDTTNPKLPPGFSIDLPVKHIAMQAMDQSIVNAKPLETSEMTISVDNAVKPGVYAFAIHVMDSNPLGSEGSKISYFYLNVE